MDIPNMQFYEENTQETQRQLDATASSSFFKFPENSVTYLYILPPWSERGLPARMVKECYLGKGQGRHTCWHTYELFGQPELGKKDPIVNAVFEAYGAMGKPPEIKKMLPSLKWYCNAIIDGVSKLGPNGEETDHYEASAEPKQVIVGFTDAMWRALTKKRNAPGVGNIFHPQSAVCVMVTRNDKTENGITAYTVALSGTKVKGEPFTPERTNVFERFEALGTAAGIPGGAQKVVEILQNLNNLEERWPMPSQEAFVEAERKAQALKAQLLGGAGQALAGAPAGQGVNFGGGAQVPVPGGFNPPGGAIQQPPAGQVPTPGIPGAIPGQAQVPGQPAPQQQQVQQMPPTTAPAPAAPAPGTAVNPQAPGPGMAQPAPTAPATPAPAQPTAPAQPAAPAPGTAQLPPGAPYQPTAPAPAAPTAPTAPGALPPTAPPGIPG